MIMYGYFFILDILLLILNRLTINSVLSIHRQSSQKESNSFNKVNPSSSFSYQQGLDCIKDSSISTEILCIWLLFLGTKLTEKKISMNCMCGLLKLFYRPLWCSLNAHTLDKSLIYVKDPVKSQSRAFFWETQKSNVSWE